MKKISSIQQLKAAKAQILQRRAELEKAIRYDWRDLKESLKPRNMAEQVFGKSFRERDEKQNGQTDFSEGVAAFAAAFARKLAAKAEEKISHWFKH
jgi:hypothetical protein